jgi:hypothetical protein
MNFHWVGYFLLALFDKTGIASFGVRVKEQAINRGGTPLPQAV